MKYCPAEAGLRFGPKPSEQASGSLETTEARDREHSSHNRSIKHKRLQSSFGLEPSYGRIQPRSPLVGTCTTFLPCSTRMPGVPPPSFNPPFLQTSHAIHHTCLLCCRGRAECGCFYGLQHAGSGTGMVPRAPITGHCHIRGEPCCHITLTKPAPVMKRAASTCQTIHTNAQ